MNHTCSIDHITVRISPEWQRSTTQNLHSALSQWESDSSRLWWCTSNNNTDRNRQLRGSQTVTVSSWWRARDVNCHFDPSLSHTRHHPYHLLLPGNTASTESPVHQPLLTTVWLHYVCLFISDEVLSKLFTARGTLCRYTAVITMPSAIHRMCHVSNTSLNFFTQTFLTAKMEFFWNQTWWQNSSGVAFSIGLCLLQHRVEILDQYLAMYWKRYNTGTQLLWNSKSRKSISFLMTLKTLQKSFQDTEISTGHWSLTKLIKAARIHAWTTSSTAGFRTNSKSQLVCISGTVNQPSPSQSALNNSFLVLQWTGPTRWRHRTLDQLRNLRLY